MVSRSAGEGGVVQQDRGEPQAAISPDRAGRPKDLEDGRGMAIWHESLRGILDCKFWSECVHRTTVTQRENLCNRFVREKQCDAGLRFPPKVPLSVSLSPGSLGALVPSPVSFRSSHFSHVRLFTPFTRVGWNKITNMFLLGCSDPVAILSGTQSSQGGMCMALVREW